METERLNRIEDNVKEMRETLYNELTDIKVSVKAIEVKVNSGTSIFKEIAKWGVMICTAIISGIFGHKFIQ